MVIKRSLPLLAVVFTGSFSASLLVSCGDRAVRDGQFHDSLVSGLSYSTPSFSGITDASGRFEYRPNEVVTFKIGAIELGKAKGQPDLTPLELAESDTVDDPEVINIARFLQTLDEDNDPNNGISITADMRLSATTDFDFNRSVADFESDASVLSYLSAYGNSALVAEESAKAHLQATLSELGYNELPEVDAGIDQTVTEGDEVTLSGAVSDADGLVVDFTWSYEQESGGPDITFVTDEELDSEEGQESDSSDESGFDAFSERFTAPDVEDITVLTFRLTAEDDAGATNSDDVRITVNPL